MKKLLAALLLVASMFASNQPAAAQTEGEQVISIASGDNTQGQSAADANGLSSLVSAGPNGAKPLASSDCQYKVSLGGGSSPQSEFLFVRSPVDQNWAGAGNATSSFVAGATLLAGQGHDVGKIRYVTLQSGSDDCSVAAWISLVEIETLAYVAFDQMRESWPSQDINPQGPVMYKGHWNSLVIDLPWQQLSATASDGGLSVTTTATPTEVTWDTYKVNTRDGLGGERYVTCDGPGEHRVYSDDAPCKVWLLWTTAGLTDRNGTADSTSLAATVDWQIGYSANFAGIANPSWFVFPTDSFLDGLQIYSTQAVGVLDSE